jgi:hypothetical protein
MDDDAAVAGSPPSIASDPQGRGSVQGHCVFDSIAHMQIQLFPYDSLTTDELSKIYADIRRSYWWIRNLRGGRFGQARLRKHYRLVEVKKKRLLLAGVSKREVLDLLACCRVQCSRTKHPFKPCTYCHFT